MHLVLLIFAMSFVLETNVQILFLIEISKKYVQHYILAPSMPVTKYVGSRTLIFCTHNCEGKRAYGRRLNGV